MSRSIVVSGNCQIVGIAEALRLLFPDDEVHLYPLHVDTDHRDHLDGQLGRADLWVAMGHQDNDLLRERSRTRADEIAVPTLVFEGFHPDLVYAVRADDTIFRGVSDYHSAIGLWAWRRGMEPAAALELFTPDVFRALGYHDSYRMSARLLQESFEDVGFDFAQFWLRIKRTGVFMHTINHPRIGALVLMAKQIARRIGADPEVLADPLERYIEDSLTASIVWPVYPPIARHLGVAGSYRFRFQDATYPTLLAFLEAQWESYGDADPSGVRPVRDDEPYDRVLDPIAAPRTR